MATPWDDDERSGRRELQSQFVRSEPEADIPCTMSADCGCDVCQKVGPAKSLIMCQGIKRVENQDPPPAAYFLRAHERDERNHVFAGVSWGKQRRKPIQLTSNPGDPLVPVARGAARQEIIEELAPILDVGTVHPRGPRPGRGLTPEQVGPAVDRLRRQRGRSVIQACQELAKELHRSWEAIRDCYYDAGPYTTLPFEVRDSEGRTIRAEQLPCARQARSCGRVRVRPCWRPPARNGSNVQLGANLGTNCSHEVPTRRFSAPTERW